MGPMPTTSLNAVALAGSFLSGAAMLGHVIAALYFLKFWKRSRDPLFVFFTVAFALLGVQRVAMLAWPRADERGQVLLYGLRLLAFVLILAAIVQKNRTGRTTAKSDAIGIE